FTTISSGLSRFPAISGPPQNGITLSQLVDHFSGGTPDTSDHRWLVGAISLLVLSYIPFLTLLGQSMSATIVATSMMSQIIALTVAFTVYGEPITLARGCGLVAALIAVIAFALPTSAKG
ncbi:MAG: hypothetical protein AAFN05_12660, partial [Pseudomonadota bacterium]